MDRLEFLELLALVKQRGHEPSVVIDIDDL
jgi:hypothetical protein